MDRVLLQAAASFNKNCIGIITRPYETYRRVVEHSSLWELGFIGIILSFYFMISSLVKTPLFRPFLLTSQFISLATAAGATYLLSIVLFWRVGTWVGGRGKFKGFAIAWGYTLLPTFLWFLVTSLLYVLLPPPRTTSSLGVIFSLIFLIFSATMFFWKITLAYLALRFGLRLSLGKILATSVVVLPALSVYGYGMYRTGIFRVPFI